MSDPSPSGETWVCRAAKGYTRCDILPCTVRGYPEHKRCGPVPSSDTPSDERDEVCGSMGPRIGDEPERPRCAQPLDHDGQHRGFPGSGFESVQWGAPIMRDEDFARTYRPAPPPTPHEPTTEDLCAQGGHAYAGDDAGRGRCYCGQTEYPLGGSSRADRGDRA